MKTRVCKTCGKTFELTAEHFFRGKGFRDGFVPSCKPCHSARQSFLNKQNGTEKKRYQRDKAKRDAHVKKWVEQNEDRNNERVRVWRTRNERRIASSALLRNYGITLRKYEEMYTRQGGVCAICGAVPSSQGRKNRLCTDHDHDTNEVRGLLCDRCNRGIGFMSEDPEILIKAANYITKHRATVPAKVIDIERKL